MVIKKSHLMQTTGPFLFEVFGLGFCKSHKQSLPELASGRSFSKQHFMLCHISGQPFKKTKPFNAPYCQTKNLTNHLITFQKKPSPYKQHIRPLSIFFKQGFNCVFFGKIKMLLPYLFQKATPFKGSPGYPFLGP